MGQAQPPARIRRSCCSSSTAMTSAMVSVNRAAASPTAWAQPTSIRRTMAPGQQTRVGAEHWMDRTDVQTCGGGPAKWFDQWRLDRADIKHQRVGAPVCQTIDNPGAEFEWVQQWRSVQHQAALRSSQRTNPDLRAPVTDRQRLPRNPGCREKPASQRPIRPPPPITSARRPSPRAARRPRSCSWRVSDASIRRLRQILGQIRIEVQLFCSPTNVLEHFSLAPEIPAPDDRHPA